MDMHEKALNIIHELREAANWTLRQLAEEADVSEQTAFRWDHGIVKPNRTNMEILAKIFHISLNELRARLNQGA